MKATQWRVMAIIIFCLSLECSTIEPLRASEAPIRSEIGRYTLLHDRNIILRDLAREKHSSFLDFNLTFSAGLKKLISDVTDATRNDSSVAGPVNDAQKQLKVYELMTKNLNTERFLDAELGLGLPLPGFNIQRIRVLPNPFFSFGAGSSFSFSNREDALQPKLQLYLRKEQKLGLRVLSLFPDKEKFTVNVYQLTRSDSLGQLGYSDVANKGKIFDLNDLTQNEVSTAADFIWEKEGTHDAYKMELSELRLVKDSKKTKKNVLYGSSPLIHARYQRLDVEESTHFSPFAGFHYRRRYEIGDGFYAGFKMIPVERIPFHFTFVLDKDFFALMPQIKTKWFEFIYAWRSPHQNPQNEIWVPAQHSLEFNFPFP